MITSYDNVQRTRDQVMSEGSQDQGVDPTMMNPWNTYTWRNKISIITIANKEMQHPQKEQGAR